MFACLSVLVITATSCSKSDSEKEEKGGGDIIGTWEYHGSILAAKGVGFIQFDKDGNCYSLLDEVEVRGDGYWIDRYTDNPYYKSHYTIKGNSLTIDCIELFDTDDVPDGYVPKNKSITFTYSVQGNSLIISGGDMDYFPSFLFKCSGTLTKSSITIFDYVKNKEAYLKKIFK